MIDRRVFHLTVAESQSQGSRLELVEVDLEALEVEKATGLFRRLGTVSNAPALNTE